MQPPERQQLMPMKPGASTWDTDDYTQPESMSKKRKRLPATQGGDAKEPAKAKKSTPKELYEKHVKYVEAHETTGGCCCAMTAAECCLSEWRLKGFAAVPF